MPTLVESYIPKDQLKATVKVLFHTHDQDKNNELCPKEYKKFVHLLEKTKSTREKEGVKNKKKAY
jgi:hypothetical protein